MKKITILLILTICSFFSFSQWQTIGNDIYYNLGKVGIGIKTAEVNLHVKDTIDNAIIRIESKNKQGALQLISNGSFKPSISFGTDGVAGSKGTIYSDAVNNQIVFRANKDYSESVELVLLNNGNLGIGKKIPAYKLDIAGDINFTGNIYKEGQLFHPDGLWSMNGNDFYYNSGNVGIGTETPGYKLDIAGDLNVTGNIYKNGQVLQSENLWLTNGNDIYYNLGKVGIGIKTAEVNLHVKDTIDNAIIRIESKNKQGGLQLISNGSFKPFISFGIDGVAGSKGGIYADVENNQIVFRANKDYSESVELVLQDNGNVGVGTKFPKAKLEISEGDIFISDIEKGIIMKSPDGKCWRGILDNSGNLTFTPIDCDSGLSLNLKPMKTQQSIFIYPNPTENVLTIILEDNTNQSIDAEIYDMAGKMIFMKNYNSSNFSINTTDFKSGAYILNLKNTNGELLKTEKIIKQ